MLEIPSGSKLNECNWSLQTEKKRRDRVSRYPSPERLFEFASLFAEVRLIGRYLLPIIELILHEYCLKNTEFPKNCTYYRLYILVTTARFLSNRSWITVEFLQLDVVHHWMDPPERHKGHPHLGSISRSGKSDRIGFIAAESPVYNFNLQLPAVWYMMLYTI